MWRQQVRPGWRGHRRGNRFPVAEVVFAFAVGAALGVAILWGTGRPVADRLDSLTMHISTIVTREAVSEPVAAQRFRVCTGSRRRTCVVDGDTFWLHGVKIRIADFDTPEVSEPRCAAELELGNKATRRLVELLNQGPFELALASDGRDEDHYGRKLRIVTRNGRSIGDTLVAEGLAHPWRGRREPWC